MQEGGYPVQSSGPEIHSKHSKSQGSLHYFSLLGRGRSQLEVKQLEDMDLDTPPAGPPCQGSLRRPQAPYSSSVT